MRRISLSKLAGVVWLVAALFSVAITLIFRIYWWQWVVTIAAGVAAAIVGVLLVWRPQRGVVKWSFGVAIAWLVLYAWLTYVQRAEQVAWNTDVFISALGAIAAAASLPQLAREASSNKEL